MMMVVYYTELNKSLDILSVTNWEDIMKNSKTY